KEKRKKGHIALLGLGFSRSPSGAKAGLQPQALRCLRRPSLITEWAASGHGVPEALKIACGKRLIDSRLPVLASHGGIARPEHRVAPKPAGQARPLPILRPRH